MRGHARQRGYAMLFAVIAVMGVAFVLVRSLNAATWKADRLRGTNAALAQAKEALIARAVADENRPGSLPCPDTNNDGQAELFVGNDCPSYVGRLPWRTLDLPDIRDADGERLWYVLSRTHRDHASAEPINSNTIGEIALVGAAPSPGLLAVIVAPGRPLIRAGGASMQARDCPANCNNPVNFLDSAGGVDNAVWAPVGGPPPVVTLTAVPETGTFNDRVLAINADDIMPLVERRAARDIALTLRGRYEGWQAAAGRGFYPWPAPFNDPANPGLGQSGTMHGHLPVAAAPLVWTQATPSLGTCTGVGTTTLTCTSLVAANFISITARVDNIASRFTLPPTAPTVTGLTVLGTTYNWTLNGGSERLVFTFSGTLAAATVIVKAPALGSFAPATSPWLVTNQWNQVATYAISDGHAINGPGICDPAPCISLGGAADKEAVIMMTGRPLAGQAARPPKPPAVVADYLEGANTTPADLALERNLRTPAFNDQPIAVRP